jgi:hypothetical protein
MTKYSLKDGFTAGKCGLFYNILPDKTYTFKEANSKGTMLIKDHHSCVCAFGWQNEVPTPCYIQVQTRQLLPCTYRANKAAWMMCDIFHELTLYVDRKLASKRKKTILSANYCHPQPEDEFLKM